MARQVRPSIFDRKLEEIRKQSELVENDLRTLSKSMRKIDEGGALPSLKSRALEQRADLRPEPPVERETRPAPAALRNASAAETLDRAFGGLSPAARALAEDTAAGESSSAEPAPLVVDTRRRPVQSTSGFGKYLATGSFGGGRPLADERRIQRNKAVFMLVIAVLAAIIVLHFMF